jgi:tetratricopeptide (TPR) repeat protein
MKKLNFFKNLLLFSLVISFLSPAWANPITKREADAWVQHVRRIMHWDSDFDVRKEAEGRLVQAELNIKAYPKSEEYKRDLADALHTLGHFAEHDHDFLLAQSLHERSLQLYKQSKFPTRESWDGIEHANEHIFMDSYDQGVILEQQGKHLDAIAWYKKAFFGFVTEPDILSKLAQGGRMGPRIRSFFSKQSDQVIMEVKAAVDEQALHWSVSCEKLFY